MAYSIIPAEDGDVSRITELVSDALIQDGIPAYAAAINPGLDNSEGRKKLCDRLRILRKHDPLHFLKVVDEHGKIVASGVSVHYPSPPVTLSGPGEMWEDQEDQDYAEHMRNERNNLLLRIFADMKGPVIELGVFFVDTTMQHKGIGSTLIRHMLESSPAGMPWVVIANPPARLFYEKHGFKVVEDAILPVPEKWQDRPKAHVISMIYNKQ